MRRIALTLAALISPLPCVAATLVVEVHTFRGQEVPEGVVFAIPEGVELAPSQRGAIMDQVDRTFVPHILPVQTGTLVSFPNSDNIRHQVYSFSPAKPFQLPLYEGTPPDPVVFDTAGVVILGCNIHDRMSAYIVVIDTPYFGLIENGKATLSIPEGTYALHAWVPRFRGEILPQTLTIDADGHQNALLRLGKE